MFNMISSPVDIEPLTPTHHQLICWKSIFAGLAITLMSYMILSALGAGIGGMTASSLISNEEGGSALATGAGLWLGLSAVISLFLGSYYTLRVSKFVTNRVGAAHGFLLASLFFILTIWGAGRAMGHLSMGIAKSAHALGKGTSDLSRNPTVQDSIHKAFGTSNLKSDPEEVTEGLAVRLIHGDRESAKNYLAYQTGQSPSEVEAKITQLQNEFDQNIKVAGEKTANAVADAGWSLFVTFLVGLLAAIIGGRVGAKENYDRPFAAMKNV